MEKELLEKYNNLGIDIDNLVKEKRENEKLKGTKFEETAATDDVRINGLLTEIHKERRIIMDEIISKRKSVFDENYLSVNRELGIKPLLVPEDEKIDFETYSSEATENLNELYSLSETFQKFFFDQAKNNSYIDLFRIGSDYPYFLTMSMKNKVLSLKLTGYVPSGLNFSINNGTDDIIQLKYVIGLLENKESALKFIFDKFWELIRKI